MPSRCRFPFAAGIDSSSLIDPPRLETVVRLAPVSSPFGRGGVRVRSLNRKNRKPDPVLITSRLTQKGSPHKMRALFRSAIENRRRKHYGRRDPSHRSEGTPFPSQPLSKSKTTVRRSFCSLVRRGRRPETSPSEWISLSTGRRSPGPRFSAIQLTSTWRWSQFLCRTPLPSASIPSPSGPIRPRL
jgi:hypothetical protein